MAPKIYANMSRIPHGYPCWTSTQSLRQHLSQSSQWQQQCLASSIRANNIEKKNIHFFHAFSLVFRRGFKLCSRVCVCVQISTTGGGNFGWVLFERKKNARHERRKRAIISHCCQMPTPSARVSRPRTNVSVCVCVFGSSLEKWKREFLFSVSPARLRWSFGNASEPLVWTVWIILLNIKY